MPPDPYSQSNNTMGNDQYTPGGYEKAKLRNLALIVTCVLVVIVGVLLLIHHSQSNPRQDKYLKSAIAAARKQTPNAEVRNLKVSGGFAVATVSDPNASGQANAGNRTIFKVNNDGTMTQIAAGSSFSPLDLLGLGIPLATQANLTGSTLGEVKQNLANICNYTGLSAPGYTGFDGSFNPDEWQIDSATLEGLEQALSNTIENKNVGTQPGKAVICVNATQKNSNAITDNNTYISTFTLQVQFITSDGTLTTHTVTFATGPNYYRNYALDGQTIQ